MVGMEVKQKKRMQRAGNRSKTQFPFRVLVHLFPPDHKNVRSATVTDALHIHHFWKAGRTT